MARTKISEFSATPASNTDIDSIFIGEGMAPSNVNDAIRELMAQLKDWQSGTSNDPYVVGSSGSLTLNQGTANGVAYLNGSKVVTSGSALTFDGTNLGVGSSPVERLQSNKGIAATGANQSVGSLDGFVADYSSGASRIFASRNGVASSTLELWTTDSGGAANKRATLDSSGNLGLGVTPSAWGSGYRAIDLGAGSSLWAQNTGSPSTFLSANVYYNGTNFIYKTSTYSSYYLQNSGNGQHQWYTAASGTAGNAITFTQAMTLDASGNLMVGRTSSDGYRFATRGSTQLLSGYQLTYDGVAAGSVTLTSGGAMAFGLDAATGSTERARIDSGGNLLVGVSGSIASGSNTTSGTQIAKTFLWVANEDASYFQRLNSDGTVQRFYRGANFIGSISVTTTGTVYNTTSDYRLKNITGALTGYKERLMSLQPKQGTWKIDGSEFRGFLAHEFAQPYSSSVSGEKDAVDDEGKPIMQAMQASSSEVMADLVALVKEQQAIIESLKARLDAANL